VEVSAVCLEGLKVELVDSLVDLPEEGVEMDVEFFDVVAIVGDVFVSVGRGCGCGCGVEEGGKKEGFAGAYGTVEVDSSGDRRKFIGLFRWFHMLRG